MEAVRSPDPTLDETARVAGLSLEELESEQSIVYLLDSDLRIVYCNPAWDQFAAENHGDALEWKKPRGTPLLEAIADPLRPFYAEGFRRVAETGEVWEHDFECSSSELYRRYHMQVKPLEATGGFLIINSLLVETPHGADRQAMPEVDTLYRGREDIVTMCCHCRRTQRSDGSQTWDWVPRYLEAPPQRVSHGLCASCSAYFYP
jgi:PAS domain-containing protein